ncbi:MAG TPA: hypothetical protein DIT32_04505 [Peptococcaceae bacterium]|nr:hypothetical protein [Peptococcaceae bacterium]
MQEWTLDLHIHTLLSPCGHDEMLPEAVIRRALNKGIDVIAITDHNSCGNVAAFVHKGFEEGLIVVPGMELQTQEEIHLICLFDRVKQALDFEKALEPRLTALKNKPKIMGEQWFVDAAGDKLKQEERFLLASVQISVDDAAALVHQFGGICIAAHADRPAFSLSAVFGTIPAEIPLDGIELTCHLERDPALIEKIKALGFTYVTASDAHYLDSINDIHCAAYLDHWSVHELRMAMKGQEGRKIITER